MYNTVAMLLRGMVSWRTTTKAVRKWKAGPRQDVVANGVDVAA